MDLREASLAEQTRHPWEVARFRFFARVLAPVLPGISTVLDVGAGDGWFSAELAGQAAEPLRITCFDTNSAEAPGATVHRSELTRVAQQPSEPFDLVLMLDVAEHVEDDLAFVRAIVSKNVKPGGRVLFSVPAWPRLWTSHDRFLQHKRRYTPAQAERLLEAAGLTLLRSGGLFFSLLPPRAAVATLERLRPARRDTSHARWTGGRAVTSLVTAALELDGRVGATLAGLGLPMPGLTWWALCSK